MSKMYVSFGDNKLTNDRLLRIYSIVKGLDVEVSLLPHVGAVRIEGCDRDVDQLCTRGGPFESKSWVDLNVFVVAHSPSKIEEYRRRDRNEEPERCVRCLRSWPRTYSEDNDATQANELLTRGEQPLYTPCTFLNYPELDSVLAGKYKSVDQVPEEKQRWLLRHERMEWKLWEKKGSTDSAPNSPNGSYEDNVYCLECFLEMKVKGWLTPVEGVCPHCMEAEHGGTKCATCHKGYPCMHGPTQAHDCAANAFLKEGAWWLLGGYGSDFDTTLFKFANLPAEITGAQRDTVDPVCDNCIRKWLAAGFLVEQNGRFLGISGWDENGDPIPY